VKVIDETVVKERIKGRDLKSKERKQLRFLYIIFSERRMGSNVID